MEDFP